MPVISSRGTDGRGTVQATTETSWSPPRREVTANTKASSHMNPYSAPDSESGQASTESAQPVQEVKSKEAVTLSPQLTALARREQKFRQQEQAFKAEQKRVEAEKAELAELKTLKADLEAKNYASLEKRGVTYDEYTQYKLNEQESQKPEAQAIQALKEEVNALKQNQEEQVTKQYEATVNQYRREVQNLVAKDPNFESIKETGTQEHVVQLILDTFHEDDEVLSVEEAAIAVEEAIIEDAMKMSRLKKVQAKQVPAIPEKKKLPPPRSGLRTLTQQIVPATKTYDKQSQFLSPRERLAQAVQKAQRPNE